MHNHHDKIRERVAKLVRLARNNPSCAEAATAFALASELASKAGLDLDSIAADDAEARDGAAPDLDVGIDDVTESVLISSQRRVAWRITLAGAICNAHGCRHWLEHGNLLVIGVRPSVATVEYLYTLLAREIESMARDAMHRRGRDRAYASAWRLGCVDAIRSRMRSQRQIVEAATSIASTSIQLSKIARATEYLHRVDRIMEIVARDHRVLGRGNLKKWSGPRRVACEGYADGAIAGKSMDIGDGARRRIGGAS